MGLTLVPYLVIIRGYRTGLKQLADGTGLLIFAGLALSWPVAVLLRDPNAFAVWMTEIGQKTGMLPIAHQSRSLLGLALPVMVLPWPVALFAGIALPFMRSRRDGLPWRPEAVWFPWSWAVVNLAMLSTWAVAKPNYYIPCLPGAALLVGMAWIHMSRQARDRVQSASARLARGLLSFQWLTILITGI